MIPHAKKSDMGQSGTAAGTCAYRAHVWKMVLPASLSQERRMDHTATLQKGEAKIMKWVSLSLTQADCKYYKILSGCILQ